jgi:hypothetical protein
MPSYPVAARSSGLPNNGEEGQPGQDAYLTSTNPASIAPQIQPGELFQSSQRVEITHLRTPGQIQRRELG